MSKAAAWEGDPAKYRRSVRCAWKRCKNPPTLTTWSAREYSGAHHRGHGKCSVCARGRSGGRLARPP